MAVPDFQSFMLPLLELSGDQKEHSISEAKEVMAKVFKLSEEDRKELLPSGVQTIYENRIYWSLTYLRKAGLLEAPARGRFRITQRGLEVLGKKPAKITTKYLRENFPEFREFSTVAKKKPAENETIKPDAESNPRETLEYAHQSIMQALAQDVLSKVKSSPPSFFENLVIDLLLKMGYGGSRADAGKAVGRSGDGGIDGIIKEDRLGLDIIYVQAKRWENTVGRPQIQAFVGALEGKRANKGIFITTSNYTDDARKYAETVGKKVVLIDGETLAKLMIEHNVGIYLKETYEIKEIDTDYFEE
ncbi:MAG: restriction endonuclease [Candidatus Altiarchaeota archaeon]|nr:restriction endonuclease [Candidatus Altiarchaeota archaeon]